MLLEAGEARSPAELKQRLAALIHRHFSAADAVRALALLERYVDYRVALGDLKPPADPRALRQSIAARQQLRERHFAQDEHLALFAADDELDRYTLARLEIGRNAGLTAAQKEAGFNNAERELTAASRTARADSIAHVAVAAQTAAFEVQGASEHERHALRRAQYGDAAALQLAQLDREERDWQARLSHYAGAKERGTDGVQLEQVRQLLFSAQEQLRIDAALALRSLQAQAPARQ